MTIFKQIVLLLNCQLFILKRIKVSVRLFKLGIEVSFLLNLDNHNIEDLLVVGDIHGDFKAFEKLIAMVPGTPVITLGDMIDRGDQSREVLSFFKERGFALLGNHEKMLIDTLEHQGSLKGDNSFELTPELEEETRNSLLKGKKYTEKSRQALRKAWLPFLKSLPLMATYKDFILTHAPLVPGLNDELEKLSANGFVPVEFIDRFVWNRYRMKEIYNKIQIYGHNRYFSYHGDAMNPWAICIDSLGSQKLTGILLPSLKIIEVERTYLKF